MTTNHSITFRFVKLYFQIDLLLLNATLKAGSNVEKRLTADGTITPSGGTKPSN